MSPAHSLVVNDPLGHEVVLPSNLCNNKDGYFDRRDILDSISDVIEKPALVIRLRGSCPQLCYYRSVGFGHTLLIKAQQSGSRWLAHECCKDPDSHTLVQLFAGGVIVYDQTAGLQAGPKDL